MRAARTRCGERDVGDGDKRGTRHADAIINVFKLEVTDVRVGNPVHLNKAARGRERSGSTVGFIAAFAIDVREQAAVRAWRQLTCSQSHGSGLQL
jgi:hypothetical protein